MKSIVLASTIIVSLLFCKSISAQEIVSNKQGVTYGEVMQQIQKLASQDNEEAKAQIKLEADALAEKKDNEDFLDLSALIYARLLDDSISANKIQAEIASNYPTGKVVRGKEFTKIFRQENPAAETVEKQYKEWLQKFPASNFEEKDQTIYSNAAQSLSGLYAGEGNLGKALEYIELTKENKGNYVTGVYRVYDTFKGEIDYKKIFPVVEDVYNLSKSDASSSDEAVKKGVVAQWHNNIAGIYADNLSKIGRSDEAVVVASEILTKTNYSGSAANIATRALGDAYRSQGKKAEAFEVYEKYIIKNGKDEKIVGASEVLYKELNGKNADFSSYLSGIDKQIEEALLAKYKGEMVKNEAPGFTLVNREGKSVSLADYKGKVVVLDFWATWCGPCIMSFPGMQAAVNKYKDDAEVEFLFIDTWQREENYKELVEDFITKNNYSFHVLFDEMKDREKATVTAYGVQGIPTKVVIDKEGFIRFQSSGGGADIQKIVDEMSVKIELAKKG